MVWDAMEYHVSADTVWLQLKMQTKTFGVKAEVAEVDRAKAMVAVRIREAEMVPL